jgi:hypothetical protein
LLNVIALNLAKLKDFSIRRADESMRILIEWSSTGLECTVEEGCEVGIDVEIGFGDFVEAAIVSKGISRIELREQT